MCRAGVEPSNILKVYLTTIRSVLEYAVLVWQNIPEYLSDAIETLPKRALKIIFPTAESYTEALQLAQLKTLAERRNDLCNEVHGDNEVQRPSFESPIAQTSC